MEWIEAVKARGWASHALTLLDVIEPIAPFIGQSLWVFAPVSRAIHGQTALYELANALETPQGRHALRLALGEDA